MCPLNKPRAETGKPKMLRASFTEKAPTLATMVAAEAALVEVAHPFQARRIEALLTTLANTARPPAAVIPASFVIRAIERTDLRTLAPALKAYVKSKKANAMAKVMAEWLLDRWSKSAEGTGPRA